MPGEAVDPVDQALARVDPRRVQIGVIVGPPAEGFAGLEADPAVEQGGGDLVHRGRVQRDCRVEVAVPVLEELDEVLGHAEPDLDERLGEQEVEEVVGGPLGAGLHEHRRRDGLAGPRDGAVARHPDDEVRPRVPGQDRGNVVG